VAIVTAVAVGPASVPAIGVTRSTDPGAQRPGDQPPAQAVSTDETAAGPGELIATYDHRRWWVEPADLVTSAWFDPRRFDAFPFDRSFQFEAEPTGKSPGVGTGRAVYLDFLRREGLTIPQLPLNGRSFILQGNSGYHLREGGFGDFAWDLSRTDDGGRRFQGFGSANEDYFVWDEPVTLPLSGYVAEIVRDRPDNPPGTILGAQANLIGIRLTGFYYLYLLHLRQDSIPAELQVGDWLPAGTFVGRVGSSGVALEPHLHLTLMWLDRYGAEPRLWSVPTLFEGLWVTPDLGLSPRFFPELVPPTGSWVSEAP